jgi:hypothetical protein
MGRLGAFPGLEPVHVGLAAAGAGDPGLPILGHRVADQGDPEVSRLGQRRQQLGRVGGEAKLPALERDDEAVVIDSLAAAGLAVCPDESGALGRSIV